MGRQALGGVTVLPTGSQSFHGRFGLQRHQRYDLEAAPPTADWRCNLTGLSQVHNLYFVAYCGEIYVYIPQFPDQALPEQPALIFTSQPSRPGLTGTLDPRRPHSVNNLIVQFLGTEEVVAAVRDDGDVDAFLVRHIVQAVERRARPDNTIGTTADELRPFFQSNVGKSAWGIAIHTEARILAVSSNTHEVRIFEFGLLQEEAEPRGEICEDVTPPIDAANGGTDRARERMTDVTYRVLNGHSNIPNIAFCNTGDDPEARWLLTTDISGVCRIMDLHALQAVQAFRFGLSFADHRYGGHDRLNAGWMIMFLDKRSFKLEHTVQSALGLEEGETLPGIQRSETVWDLSKTVEKLPEALEPFVYDRPKQTNGSSVVLGDIVHYDDAHSEEDPSLSEDESDGGAPVQIDIDIESSTEGDELEVEITADAEEDIGMDGTEEQNATAVEHESPQSDTMPYPDPALVDDGEDLDDEGTEDTVPFNAYYSGESLCGHEPRFTSAAVGGLPCPILHASVHNIYMLQLGGKESATNPFVFPMVGFAKPLRQALQMDYCWLRNFERLNMSAYIPELGVVVLGSQKGRAIVLALTKMSSSVRLPPEMRGNAGKTNYGMKAVAILPFAHQEKARLRPPAPLYGISTGPIQGSEEADGERKRWRLMLMYQDHSILSYEIARPCHGGSNGFEAENLVV